ncbi:MAG TPA: PQQ-binding-like beta-propeller repeat protein [Gammaproteobacteria bacterium]|nr:PQQ-binding-like beta-propeller repeat protein [Gammaproteobacteria bacterium]
MNHRTIGALFGTMLALALVAPQPALAGNSMDWPTFGWNAARTGAPMASMGITAANVGKLHRQQVRIDGTVDSSPIYLHGVRVKSKTHDVFFVTTTYGKTIAIDADHGTILWEYTPPAYKDIAGSAQITTATPVADPDRQFIYAAAPDGMIRKLAIADGHVVWQTSITRLPSREKIASPLGYAKGHIIATTGGYIGDAPPYQGHVAILDAKIGKLLHVWNALCSDRHGLIEPSSCPESGAAIWGRAGAVVDPRTGDLYVATGNAAWDGKRYFGDAVIELNADATRMLGNYTPQNTIQLSETDEDVGSSSPALLGHNLVAQGGKDGQIRLLDWSKMRGMTPHRGGASQHVPSPGAGDLRAAQAVLQKGSTTWLFAADDAGTSAWTLSGGKLDPRWQNDNAGTSPVVADGLLFVYDPEGGLNVYDPTTGQTITKLDCGSGHWNSPVVADGRIAVTEGDANDHDTNGILDIWRR